MNIPKALKEVLEATVIENYMHGTEPLSVLVQSEIAQYYTDLGQPTEQALDSAEKIGPFINKALMAAISKRIKLFKHFFKRGVAKLLNTSILYLTTKKDIHYGNQFY